jgi:rubrerythrin
MNTLEMAMKMEEDAISFYEEAAKKTKYPAGKKMFGTIVEDEKRHVETITRIIKGLHITDKDVSPINNVKSVFDGMKSDMMKKVKASPDELNAFKIAMKMEQESVEFYKNALKTKTTDKEKVLLERLIQEEKEHYEIFSNTYQFLANTGSWFLWEERAILDGGTPWA